MRPLARWALPPPPALKTAPRAPLGLPGVHEMTVYRDDVQELELVFGADRAVRINVDGICVLHIKLAPTAIVVPRGAGLTDADVMDLLTRSLPLPAPDTG